MLVNWLDSINWLQLGTLILIFVQQSALSQSRSHRPPISCRCILCNLASLLPRSRARYKRTFAVSIIDSRDCKKYCGPLLHRVGHVTIQYIVSFSSSRYFKRKSSNRFRHVVLLPAPTERLTTRSCSIRYWPNPGPERLHLVSNSPTPQESPTIIINYRAPRQTRLVQNLSAISILQRV